MAPDAASYPTVVPQRGWWKDYLGRIPDGYLDFIAAEEDANRIVHFHPTFVPGLLQTERYAAALTPATTLKTLNGSDVTTLVGVRMLRQQVAFNDTSRKRMVFLFDETALRRPVGAPVLMRDQLTHLLEMLEHPAVTIVVVPFESGPHAGLLGAFTIFGYGNGLNDVLWFEWQLGNENYRGPDQADLVRKYDGLANELASADPDGTVARQLIVTALDHYHR